MRRGAKGKFESDNLSLFDMSGGSTCGNAPVEPAGSTTGDGGSSPTPPLHTHPDWQETPSMFGCKQSKQELEDADPIRPKEVMLKRIPMKEADYYSIQNHYLHRTAKNSKIAFGIFARGVLHGIMIWGLPVAKVKGQFGERWTQLELRRMYCDASLPKNSESRCLSIARTVLHKLFPQCKLLIAYSDLGHGHQGTIYKAAGWRLESVIQPDADGGWSKHKRHKRVEHGVKKKWFMPMPGGG